MGPKIKGAGTYTGGMRHIPRMTRNVNRRVGKRK